VRSGVAFNRQLSGEYIEWAGISLDGGERVEFVVDITLPEA